MSLQALRRWIARHPLSWVLGLALVLGGAQGAAAAHEFTHVASAAAAHDDAHVSATHDCPICLLAAALGGAAPTPAAGLPVASQATATVADLPQLGHVARVMRAYAPRAPPASATAPIAA